ncbi:MAG: hypothetical protein JJE29_08745 [Peptostreptococcaceae bacterium]|nr:hypothetical protein [Peptostreptococcaceae bacterium]
MEIKTIVVALGGNAIRQPRQQGTAGQQLENVRKTCVQIAQMIEKGHRIFDPREWASGSQPAYTE